MITNHTAGLEWNALVKTNARFWLTGPKSYYTRLFLGTRRFCEKLCLNLIFQIYCKSIKMKMSSAANVYSKLIFLLLCLLALFLFHMSSHSVNPDSVSGIFRQWPRKGWGLWRICCPCNRLEPHSVHICGMEKAVNSVWRQKKAAF